MRRWRLHNRGASSFSREPHPGATGTRGTLASESASSSATWQTLQFSLFNSLGKPKNPSRLCQPTHQPTPEGATTHYDWGLTSVYPGILGLSSVMIVGRSRDSGRSQGSGFHKWWKAIPKIKPNRPRKGAHPR